MVERPRYCGKFVKTSGFVRIPDLSTFHVPKGSALEVGPTWELNKGLEMPNRFAPKAIYFGDASKIVGHTIRISPQFERGTMSNSPYIQNIRRRERRATYPTLLLIAVIAAGILFQKRNPPPPPPMDRPARRLLVNCESSLMTTNPSAWFLSIIAPARIQFAISRLAQLVIISARNI
jgi:hypothetical protein